MESLQTSGAPDGANNSVEALNEAPEKQVTISDDDFVPYTKAQEERTIYLAEFYDLDHVDQIMSNLTQYRDNTWLNVFDKIKAINAGLSKYEIELANLVEVNKTLELRKIVHLVSSTRKSLAMGKLEGNIIKNCVKEMFKTFMVEPIYSHKFYKGSKEHVLTGYRPTFDLKCQF